MVLALWCSTVHWLLLDLSLLGRASFPLFLSKDIRVCPIIIIIIALLLLLIENSNIKLFKSLVHLVLVGFNKKILIKGFESVCFDGRFHKKRKL